MRAQSLGIPRSCRTLAIQGLCLTDSCHKTSWCRRLVWVHRPCFDVQNLGSHSHVEPPGIKLFSQPLDQYRHGCPKPGPTPCFWGKPVPGLTRYASGMIVNGLIFEAQSGVEVDKWPCMRELHRGGLHRSDISFPVVCQE